MRFKVIAALVVVAALMGASAGVALATSRSSRPSSTTTGVERYWVGDWSRTTFNPTVFVGTGLFTAAGKSGMGGVKFSNGSFLVDKSKLKAKSTFNARTCFASETASGTISFHGGTGAYKGISGKLSIGGQIVLIFPRLKNGKCNASNTAVPVAVLGQLSGSGKVTL
jgi:hypothetical protein